MRIQSNQGLIQLALFATLLLPSAGARAEWNALTSGGRSATSTNYRHSGSLAQPTTGLASNASSRHGAGFWYGVSLCDCPFQADLDGSGAVDAVDLAIVIDIVFFGAADVLDPQCPTSRGDFNNDGVPDAVDLAELIDHVFFGGAGPDNPCQPS